MRYLIEEERKYNDNRKWFMTWDSDGIRVNYYWEENDIIQALDETVFVHKCNNSDGRYDEIINDSDEVTKEEWEHEIFLAGL